MALLWEDAVSANAVIAVQPADHSRRVQSRPFGPLPRAAVAIYGALLAVAGLTLCIQAGPGNVFWAAGANALLLGVGCLVLAARVGRVPRGTSSDAAPETADTRLAAARVVTELEDLQRQVAELTEQCATFDVQWTDEDPQTHTPTSDEPSAIGHLPSDVGEVVGVQSVSRQRSAERSSRRRRLSPDTQ
ncbi:MAG TPA: hypothetical protein VE081_08990 [Sporichthyaceae bacterium]|nr:hypothetical protein [Sporichthyaceae bacterium]